MEHPTNAELLGAFKEHAANDEAFQDETRKATGEQATFKAETEGKLAELAVKIDGLATKEDIADLKEFMRRVKIGEGILKFSWDNLGKIGSLFTFIVGIFLFFKFGIGGVVAFFLGHK